MLRLVKQLTFSSTRMTSNDFKSAIKFVQFSELSSRKGLLIDVREKLELQEHGEIENSLNIPLGDLDNALKLSESEFMKKYGRPKPDTDDEIIVSCKSGKRSTLAAEIVARHCFRNVKNYVGGFDDYSRQRQQQQQHQQK